MLGKKKKEILMPALSIGQEWSAWGTVFKTIRRNLTGKKLESEVAALKELVPLDGICLDIGAGYGRYAYVLSGHVGPGGRVFCFEPGHYSRSVLNRVIRFHGLRNVEILPQAVGDCAKKETLHVPIKNGQRIAPSLASLGSTGSKGFEETVDVVTLDTFVKERRVERVDFIKCDVEGGEMSVFRGGREVLERFRPLLLMEICRGHLQKFNLGPQDVLQWMQELGYRAAQYVNRTFVEVLNVDQDHNYFFIPQKRNQP